MILPVSHLPVFLTQLQADSLLAPSPLLLLLYPTVDSLCALSLLTELLKPLHITYTVKYIHNIPQLKHELINLPKGDDDKAMTINNVVCLNVGVSIPLAGLLPECTATR